MTTTTRVLDAPTTAIDPDRSRRLRRGLVAFAGSGAVMIVGLDLVARSAGADVAHLDDSSVGAQLALFGVAFVPLVAMLLAWAVSGIGPQWGFRRCSLRTLGTAWLVPVVAAALAYPTAWLLNIGDYDASGVDDSFGGLPVPVAVVVALVPGLIPWMLLAAGEQLGWSSWFVVRLAEIAPRRVLAPLLGIGWGLAHVPLMLLIPGAVPDGIPKWFAVAMFFTETVALAYPLVWLRLDSRSIWPVLVLHAGINASLYFVGDLLTSERSSTDWYLGEGAALTAASCVLSVLVTAPLWRGKR